jgi:predicted nucleotidyltransferase component of viral defense system
MERLLERVSVSQYKDQFVLKGGVLVAALVGISSRTTMDLDATLREFPLSEVAIQSAWQEICAIGLEDEVTFSLGQILPIREDDLYGGYRVSILARYESINTPLKIDLTAGDAITPGAVRFAFHSNFIDKVFEVWAYNIETILAEKMETILRRSVLNTRPRDYYDVYILMKTQRERIDLEIFWKALLATSSKRMSQSALENKSQILQEINSDATLRQRWQRYIKDNYYATGIAFDQVMEILTELVELV